ncbi:hypothetical protein GCM10027320_39230 [Massilia solisilvae]
MDVVGQAVGQLAHLDLGADRNRRRQIDRRERGQRGGKQGNGEGKATEEVSGHRQVRVQEVNTILARRIVRILSKSFPYALGMPGNKKPGPG